ncbi:MAG: hypothetical protein M0R28_03360 [Pigmentiphaga sp.]|nr:hypothetical protein [Pigmentiphaga sp.]
MADADDGMQVLVVFAGPELIGQRARGHVDIALRPVQVVAQLHFHAEALAVGILRQDVQHDVLAGQILGQDAGLEDALDPDGRSRGTDRVDQIRQ